jgi:hypothetical protein
MLFVAYTENERKVERLAACMQSTISDVFEVVQLHDQTMTDII